MTYSPEQLRILERIQAVAPPVPIVTSKRQMDLSVSVPMSNDPLLNQKIQELEEAGFTEPWPFSKASLYALSPPYSNLVRSFLRCAVRNLFIPHQWVRVGREEAFVLYLRDKYKVLTKQRQIEHFPPRNQDILEAGFVMLERSQ